MGPREEHYLYSPLNQFKDKIKFYGCYICFMFSGTEQELSFHKYLNTINDSLKLSLQYNHEKN